MRASKHRKGAPWHPRAGGHQQPGNVLVQHQLEVLEHAKSSSNSVKLFSGDGKAGATTNYVAQALAAEEINKAVLLNLPEGATVHQDEVVIEVKSTPSSKWAAAGEPDPHGSSYDCERAALCLGRLTDDELANGAFMNYDVRPAIQDIIDGKAVSPIGWMTAVKDRIRWLSRALTKSDLKVRTLAEAVREEVQAGAISAGAADRLLKIIETKQGDAEKPAPATGE